MSREAVAGSDGRGDCVVRVSAAKSLKITVRCGNPPLLEPGIRAVAERTAEAAGVSGAAIEIADSGALDFVLSARVEAALREAVDGATAIGVAPQRKPSRRDRLRRSRLYSPGNNPRLLLGIEMHGADCLLFDLEDAVPPAEKAAARVLVKHLLATVTMDAEAWVRINPLDAGGGEDLVEVIPARPHGVCLPKAEDGDDVRAVAERIAALEDEAGLEAGLVWILPIVETARGTLHAEEIAAADPRVVSLAFGAEDYLRDTGARRSWEALLWPRAQLLAAARSAGVQASDTVYSNVDDDDGLRSETCAVRDLGFDGKGAIHPRQVPILHDAFAPSEEEVDRARRIVAAAEEAEAQGIGAVTVDGRMVDRPVVDRARRTLALADGTEGGGSR
ncbi:MAG: HpcH/HpaI aldolase/citrate lyase family protein [Candidatus Bipolaricaulota bacterium]|nr:MAG: HpcH/HpaI aldolase/citrate lyase family protein [Candidatus Bipolaricaulota bacterium]